MRFLLFILFASSGLISIAANYCFDKVTQIDDTLKTLLFLKSRQRLPKSDPQLLNYCSRSEEISKYVFEYSNCTTVIQKAALNLLIRGATKSLRSICKEGKNIKKLKHTLNCIDLRYLKNVRSLGVLMTKHFNTIDSLETTGDNILALICCSIKLFKEQVKQIEEPVCADKDVHINNYVLKQFSDVTDDVSEIICGRIKSVDDCNVKVPHWSELINSNIVEESNSKKSNLVMAIMNVIKKSSDSPLLKKGLRK